jgi:hypothetical protein
MALGFYFVIFLGFYNPTGTAVNGPAPVPIGPYPDTTTCATARATAMVSPTFAHAFPSGSNADVGVSGCFAVGK